MIAPLIALVALSQLPTWAQVDQLENEQKYEAAAAAVEKRLAQAKKGSDDTEHATALIRLTRLRTGLGGLETAVKRLREEPWPKGFMGSAMVRLYYSATLRNYLQRYQWEIREREKVETKGAIDLKSWTREQIFAEALKAIDEVWQQRVELGAKAIGSIPAELVPNNYPAGVRDTLRDAVSYLFAEALADSQGWTPEQSNQVYQLDLGALLAKGQPKEALGKPNAHPLTKSVAVLDELEQWRQSKGTPDGQLEARLARLDLLRKHFTTAPELERIRADLTAQLPQFKSTSWWSMGQSRVAEWLRAEGNLVGALEVARAGVAAYPQSIGGQRCASIAAQLVAPDLSIQAMETDGARKRTLQLHSKNLEKVWFRAFRTTLGERAQRSTSDSLLPNQNEVKAWLAGGLKPVASWSQALPATPDLQAHVTYVVPPFDGPGLYSVVASAREDFSEANNRLLVTHLTVSDLTLLTKRGAGSVEVQVVRGDGGAPVSGAQVQLWSWRYNTKGKLEEKVVTGADGLATFKGGRPHDRQYYVIAQQGTQEASELQGLSFYEPTTRAPNSALIFTDRSVYRPKQKLYFKVVPYRGNSEGTDFSVQNVPEVTVRLLDPNYQLVEERKVKPNGFGTAAGEFVIPTGRVLGQWQLQAQGATSWVRVEEYKRPTFEVAFQDDGQAMKLNAPATLTGNAKYYFGLPVTSGQVKWRVRRTPQYPWWWGWWGWSTPSSQPQVVGVGASSLANDGTFKVSFTPAADPKLKREVTYRYEIEADVTDDGGETRSAQKSVRLGVVSIEATVSTERGFYRAGEPISVRARRANLDGVGRAGQGTWKVVALQQPKTALLPAEEPITFSPEQSTKLLTEGDKLRPRWTGWSAHTTLRQWGDGAAAGQGSATHDAQGDATLTLPGLKPGAYRVRYETKDEAGEKAESWTELVVAGPSFELQLPAYAELEQGKVSVGQVARLFLGSAFKGQPLIYEEYRGGKRVVRKVIAAGNGNAVLERPVTADDRGGFSIQVTAVRDWQVMQFSHHVTVPWDDKALQVEFATFRDTLRPGAKETFSIKVKGPKGQALEAGAAEVLAYMYDQSLDAIAPHSPPNPLGMFAHRQGLPWQTTNVGAAYSQWLSYGQWYPIPSYPHLHGDVLPFLDSYGIGGLGRGGGGRFPGSPLPPPSAAPAPMRAMREEAPAEPEAAVADAPKMKKSLVAFEANAAKDRDEGGASGGEGKAVQVRENFAETAFFMPSLVSKAEGQITIEFQVPDSVTAWNVWAHALTRDWKSGFAQAKTRSVKELMVRPYLPRFLRESDQAQLKVVVNNASAKPLSGELTFELFDPETQASLAKEFQLSATAPQPFSVAPGQSSTVTVSLVAPRRVGQAAVRVIGKAGDLSDGELRPLPLLPSRMHLAQSRFVTLKDKDSRSMTFADLAKGGDPTLVNEQLVVTVDAQLFTTVLQSLPYLMRYPYECTEQTLNRFLSAGIVGSVFRDHPAVASMSKKLAARTTPLETFDALDPNRKIALEETPWLLDAKGGNRPGADDAWINMLDPKVVEAEKASALTKLAKAQLSNGGWPWWPGGSPSPYLTVYLLSGFAKAAEFKVDVPKDMVMRAWPYVAQELKGDLRRCMALDGCWEMVTFINYTASSFPDESWLNGALSLAERNELLAFSFKHWKQHSPMLKAQLALTLKRMKRDADAKLVFDSVMDSSKTTQDDGTFWQPEDRAWLWYRDTIEGHATALRALTELAPKDSRRAGLVQWLLLNKKLNQWKSTRATSEVIYALVKYMKAEGQLGSREESNVAIGPITKQLVFLPDEYTGKKNQIVVPGPEIDAKTMSTVTVSKATKGFQFASATWHFSTDKLPTEARGDLFGVSRTYFKREKTASGPVLKPLAEGAKLEPGDELEVQLSLTARQEAEFVHLKDPRGAGFEPDAQASRFKWNQGLGWYEEYRDSGTNFFFERLPPGQYTFKYRVRAATGGTFRVGPAMLQSMYAPEFTAYSQGHQLSVATGGR